MTTRRQRRAALVATSALGVVVFALGCAQRPDDGEATIRFWGLGREGEVVKELLPEFHQQHPEIRVIVQQIPWTAAHEKLLSAFVGGSTPDVAQLGNTWIPEFALLGALENLEPRQRATSQIPASDYFAGIWNSNQIEAALYGIPWYVDTRLLFYRRDRLAEVGFASAPEQWSSWRAAMQRVRERHPETWGVLMPTDEWAQLTIFALQLGAPIVDVETARGAFDEPRFRAALEFYVALFRERLAPRQNNAQVGNVYQQFADGAYATYITGPWNLGEFSSRLPAAVLPDWGVAPLPAPDSSATMPGVSLAGGASLVLFRRSRNQEASWQLIEYLSQPEVQRRFYQLTGDLPARISAWDDPALRASAPLAAFRRQLERVVTTPKLPEWEQIAAKIAEQSERAALGACTIDQAIEALQRDTDRILEKRRWLASRRVVHG